MNGFITELHGKSATTATQAQLIVVGLRKPAVDAARFKEVWETVYALKDAY